MGKFKKGLFVGGLLGAGLTWLNTTKKGRETREKILDYAAEVYTQVKEKVMASGGWDKMTKAKYVKIVKQVVDTYAIDNGLAANVKTTVGKLVASQWKRVKK